MSYNSPIFYKKSIPNKKKILTIITIVMNDPDGLVSTAKSLDKFKTVDELEYIVWVNHRSTAEIGRIDEYCQYADIIIHGEDHGIFDAMNRAMHYANGDYVLFLNARDHIIEPFNLNEIVGPCLVPVKYRDYFGRVRFVRVSKAIEFGIPYCHQGMILPRIGYQFDAYMRYGADYLALLNFNIAWPLPMLTQGLIEYDSTGVSTVNRWDSDKWTARVIKHRFGYSWTVSYLVFCICKLIVKRIYDFKVILLGK